MRIIIQKFGGTSLATESSRMQAIDKIKQGLLDGYSIVVVVSAMGRKGQPYATDSLLSLIQQPEMVAQKKESDLLLSCGELISAVVFSHELIRENIPATVLTGQQAGIITDDCFGEAKIIGLSPNKILEHLNENKVVVVTGFQGATESGEITTLGRGGSDTSAAALGVALDAALVEIYTDVDGIMTADPRIVPNAKILDIVTYNEICHLAYQGAKVIHPRAVEMAMKKNIPLKIKSTFSDAPGTLVTTTENVNESLSNERLITGITSLSNISQFTIDFPSDLESAIPRKIFVMLAEAKISVDFINVGKNYAVFTVKDEAAEKASALLKDLDLTFTLTSHCAKVSVVGANMTGVPGVMAKIISALSEHKIEILQTSDSYTTIWCLVAQENMETAVRALHNQFNLG